MNQPVDASQLARLLDEYSASLALYASQWTRSPEDCVQEAFIALAAQANSPDNLVAWLFRVVRNRALNEFRSTQRRFERERNVAQHPLSRGDPAIESEKDEERKRMLRELDQLESRDRELIVLRIWSGLSWSEIAEVIGSSSSSAQRHYVGAIEKMRSRMERQCQTNPK